MPAKRTAEWRVINDLIDRLQKIELGVAIYARLENQASALTERSNKRAYDAVRRWLQTMPPVGSQLETEHLVFEVDRYNPAYSRLQCVGPGTGFMVDSTPVEERLNLKVKKYGDLARQRNLPLVLAVIPDFGTGLGRDDLENVLFGDLAVGWLSDPETDRASERGLLRRAGGRFEKTPALSAMLWIERLNLEWTMSVHHNPYATLPITGLLAVRTEP